MSEDTTRKTDFGAPIVAGPFDSMQEAQGWIAGSDLEGLDIYWEDSSWFVHGPTADGGGGAPLTTYGT